MITFEPSFTTILLALAKSPLVKIGLTKPFPFPVRHLVFCLRVCADRKRLRLSDEQLRIRPSDIFTTGVTRTHINTYTKAIIIIRKQRNNKLPFSARQVYKSTITLLSLIQRIPFLFKGFQSFEAVLCWNNLGELEEGMMHYNKEKIYR